MDISEEESLDRVIHRRIDPLTGDSYRIKDVTPPNMIYDRLVTQTKDQEHVARTLLMDYMASANGTHCRAWSQFDEWLNMALCDSMFHVCA